MDFELEMRVLTLDMGVVEWCGRELEMKAREFDPELVVAIARGGVTLANGSLTVKKAKNTKIIGLQFGRTNFCSYLCSNTRYYLSRVFANL